MTFTIIIATFNSMKTLPLTLDAILRQSVGIENIEVLLVDGFSTDGTRDIQTKYPFVKLIDNPLVDPVNAKYLGYTKASCNYIIYLDHDEVLENTDSLLLKKKSFEENSSLVAISTSGYKNPEGYSFLNQYINDFGDPFSAFYYNLSKDFRFFIKEMKKKYHTSMETDLYISFDFKTTVNLPLIELCAAGSCIRKSYLDLISLSPMDIPLVFLKIVKSDYTWGVSKNDYLIHYSSEEFDKYKNKIKWRIRNNIFHLDSLGKSGFTGRENQSSIQQKIKKTLFIPYNFLIIPVIAHAILLSIKHKSLKYLTHVPLSFYTALWIIFYLLLKIVGFHPAKKSYDGEKTIKS